MSVRRASVSSQVFVADKTDATVAEAGSDGSSGQEQQYPLPWSTFARVYRSTLFNVIIAGLISFTQPGIWNALNSQSTAMSAQSSYVMETDSNFVRHWRGRSTRTLPCERGKLVNIRTNGTCMSTTGMVWSGSSYLVLHCVVSQHPHSGRLNVPSPLDILSSTSAACTRASGSGCDNLAK